MKALVYSVFRTGMGWVGVLASDEGLLRTTLPCATPEDARADLGPDVQSAREVTARLADVVNRIRGYFEGRAVSFSDALVLNGTPFQQRVWQATRLIPYGETRTYSEIAGQVGSPGAARAVGQALGANPFPIIVPCHRVIASGGGLGGFGGGLVMKATLLNLERGLASAMSSRPGHSLPA